VHQQHIFETNVYRNSGLDQLGALPSAAAASTAAASTVVITTLARGSVSVAGDVGSRPLLLGVVVLGIVGDSLAFVQALEAILLDLGEVDKDVLAAISRGDEAEALIGEKLDSSGVSHDEREKG
jgi:hypothetical protein